MVTVSVPMYENLGAHWTLTLLGCIATPLAPVPYVFKYWCHSEEEEQGGNELRVRWPTASGQHPRVEVFDTKSQISTKSMK
jgi:hypothetical protein